MTAPPNVPSPAPRRRRTITVEELFEYYLKWAKGYYRKPDGQVTLTVRNIDQAFRLTQMGRPLIRRLPLDRFRAATLYKVQQEMVRRGLAQSTINDRVKWIRSAFKWGATPPQSYCTPEQAQHLYLVAAIKRYRSGVTPTEPRRAAPKDLLAALLLVAPAKYQTMIRFQMYSGARPIECCNLRRSWINRDGPIVDGQRLWIISVDGHTNKTEYLNRSRRFFAGPAAQAALDAWMDIHKGNVMFPGSEPNRPITVVGYRTALRRICEYNGLPLISPAQFRKNGAQRALLAGGIDAAQQQLGHASPTTTMRYLDLRETPNAAKAAAISG